jgi:hypothetical protein
MKQKPIHSKMFKCLLENVDTQHKTLLLHTGIQWLSRRRVLNRVFELNGVLKDYFLEDCKLDFATFFEDEIWLQKLAYFADIFHHSKQVNKSLQGPRESVFTSSGKFVGFKRKLNLWKNRVVK